MSEQGNQKFSEFERQLAELAPRASRVEQATLMFRAGQESMRTSHNQSRGISLWPLATAAMTIVSIGLSWQLFLTNERQTVDQRRMDASSVRPNITDHPQPRVAVVDKPTLLLDKPTAPTTRPTPHVLPPNHYLKQRRLALLVGLDAIQRPQGGHSTASTQPLSYRELKEAFRDGTFFGSDHSSPGDES
jgi:hypothetical protein